MENNLDRTLKSVMKSSSKNSDQEKIRISVFIDKKNLNFIMEVLYKLKSGKATIEALDKPNQQNLVDYFLALGIEKYNSQN
jgi:hypothetical protein